MDCADRAGCMLGEFLERVEPWELALYLARARIERKEAERDR